MTAFFKNGGDVFFLVKRRVVHHDDAWFFQQRQKSFLQPHVDDGAVARLFEKHRRQPFFLPLRHDEIDAFAVVAGHIPVNFFTARRPAVRTFLKPLSSK